MGLPRGQVRIEDYSSEWARSFAEEQERLLAAIGHVSRIIEHVGSTAVPGLCAKPVIDIAVGVAELSIGAACVEPLAGIGYEYKGDAGINGRHFFAKGPPEDRTCYVHVEPLNGPLWRNHILFRDYLRTHPDAARAYGQLKRSLAARYSRDRDTYASGKNAFVENILASAAELYELNAAGQTYLRAKNRMAGQIRHYQSEFD